MDVMWGKITHKVCATQHLLIKISDKTIPVLEFRGMLSTTLAWEVSSGEKSCDYFDCLYLGVEDAWRSFRMTL